MSSVGNQINSNTASEVEYTTSNFHLHKFNAVILDRKIVYQVLKMIDSLLIFINERDNMQLNDLFVSLPSRFGGQPLSTRLLGDFMEESSKIVASRVSKKLSKTVYVSCNVNDDTNLLPLVEKRIFDEIKEKPEMF